MESFCSLSCDILSYHAIILMVQRVLILFSLPAFSFDNSQTEDLVPPLNQQMIMRFEQPVNEDVKRCIVVGTEKRTRRARSSARSLSGDTHGATGNVCLGRDVKGCICMADVNGS